MTQYNLSKELLEVKLADYKINSSLMPEDVGKISKSFARLMGNSAGKIVSIYNNLYSQIENGLPVEEIQKSIRIDTSQKSKMQYMKTKQARICGLVAMNHSGFFNQEIEFYSSLMNDLKGKSTIDNVVERAREAGMQNSSKYEDLLAQKQQSIYDFNVLMGVTDDESRLSELTKNMNPRKANYFNVISSRHKGKFGVTWPIPFKHFSDSVREGFTNDTISHAVQEGVGKDYGFVLPSQEKFNNILGKFNGDNLSLNLGNAKYSLPAALLFLSEMNAYATRFGEDGDPSVCTMGGGLFSSAATLFTCCVTNDDIPSGF